MNNTALAINLFDKLAETYQDKYMDVSMYHDSFDLFCSRVNRENADILDVACGPGNITQYLLKKRTDFQVLGIDLSPNMIRLARLNNPSATFEVMDCREIGSIGKKFDAIMCGFCLPYLSKEAAVQLIQDATRILNPQGILYISTMEDDYEKSGLQIGSSGDQLYMYFHEADYLTDALQKNGFTFIDVQRKCYRAGNGSDTTDLLIVAGLETRSDEHALKQS